MAEIWLCNDSSLFIGPELECVVTSRHGGSCKHNQSSWCHIQHSLQKVHRRIPWSRQTPLVYLIMEDEELEARRSSEVRPVTAGSRKSLAWLCVSRASGLEVIHRTVEDRQCITLPDCEKQELISTGAYERERRFTSLRINALMMLYKEPHAHEYSMRFGNLLSYFFPFHCLWPIIAFWFLLCNSVYQLKTDHHFCLLWMDMQTKFQESVYTF